MRAPVTRGNRATRTRYGSRRILRKVTVWRAVLSGVKFPFRVSAEFFPQVGGEGRARIRSRGFQRGELPHARKQCAVTVQLAHEQGAPARIEQHGGGESDVDRCAFLARGLATFLRCRACARGTIFPPGILRSAAISACTRSRPAPSWPGSSRRKHSERAIPARRFPVFATRQERANRRARRRCARARARRFRPARRAAHRTRYSKPPPRCSVRCREAPAPLHIRAENSPHAGRRFPLPRVANSSRGCNSRGRPSGPARVSLSARASASTFGNASRNFS